VLREKAFFCGSEGEKESGKDGGRERRLRIVRMGKNEMRVRKKEKEEVKLTEGGGQEKGQYC